MSRDPLKKTHIKMANPHPPEPPPMERVVLMEDSLDDDETNDFNVTLRIHEIDSWNHEWERIVLLCDKTLVIFKYDFIGMKIEEARRVELAVIDKVTCGGVAYPQGSLTPKINGLAEGIVGVVKDCIIPTAVGTVQKTAAAGGGLAGVVGSSVAARVWGCSRGMSSESSNNGSFDQVGEEEEEVGVEVKEDHAATDTLQQVAPATATDPADSAQQLPPPPPPVTVKDSIMAALSLSERYFDAKSRGKPTTSGIQILWNESHPLSYRQKWNPFDKTIPRATFTSHPLHQLKHTTTDDDDGVPVSFFDVDSFTHELLLALGQGRESADDDLSPCCRIEYKPIVIESYVGIASLVHNAGSLGFYKVRGRVSF